MKPWEDIFFEEYATTLNISKSAKAAGKTRQAVYWRLSNDEDFKRRFEATRAVVAAAMLDKGVGLALNGTAEPIVFRGEVVAERTKEYPDLIKFFLSKLDPDTFGDQPTDTQDAPTIIQMPMPMPERRDDEPGRQDA